ncbi:MAG: hypothetical protein M3Q44_01035 [bacterium]|nr:hypothetical protein [bacterium]
MSENSEQQSEATTVTIAEDRFTHASEILIRDIKEVSCIDGRKLEPGVNVPGGDAGLIAVEISTAEEITGIEFTPEMTDQFVVAHIKKYGSVYLHSDMHVAERIAADLHASQLVLSDNLRTKLQGDNGAFFVSELIQDPDAVLAGLGTEDITHIEAIKEALLEGMTTHIGCGHLAQMDSRSSEYDTRKGVVGNIIRSIVRARWGDQPVTVDFLLGDHAELLVVVYEQELNLTESGRIRIVSPKQDAKPIFPLYPQIAALRYNQALDIITPLFGNTTISIDREAFVAAAIAKGDKQAGLTMPALASTLQKNGTLPDGIIPIVSVRESAEGTLSIAAAGSFKA